MAVVDPAALALLAAAHATPVISARLLGARWNTPIDAIFRARDGHPVFGTHKTWRGLTSGLVASAILGALLPCGLWLGLEFGALALAGDLFSSFVKRRLDRPEGTSLPLLDQLPEALLPLGVLAGPLGLGIVSILGTATCFTVLDVLTERWRPSPAKRAPPSRTHGRDRPAPPGTR